MTGTSPVGEEFDDIVVNRPPKREMEPVTVGTGRLDVSALPGLCRRLRSGSDGVIHLDIDVDWALGHGADLKIARYTQSLYPVIRWSAPHPYAGESEPCPSFTTSIDAVLRLAAFVPGVDAVALLKDSVAQIPDVPIRAVVERFPRAMLIEMLEGIAAASGGAADA